MVRMTSDPRFCTCYYYSQIMADYWDAHWEDWEAEAEAGIENN